MNIKLVIEYDGTCYHGYQIQNNGNTVQAELEKALGRLVADDFILYCAGRTDTGVHAFGQVCNFKCEKLRVAFDRFGEALNGILPSDICIKQYSQVADDFHSRFSAKERIYKYVIFNSKNRSALNCRYSWHLRKNLNVENMKKASETLIGTHDFKAFTVASFPDTTVRNVYGIDIDKSENFVNIEIRANAFTRSMVRNIVGTLAEIGMGKRSIEEMQIILNSKDRSKAGICAPAKGLFLMGIKY